MDKNRRKNIVNKNALDGLDKTLFKTHEASQMRFVRLGRFVLAGVVLLVSLIFLAIELFQHLISLIQATHRFGRST